MSRATVMIVDDEAYVRDSLALILNRRGFAVRVAGTTTDALLDESLEGLDAVLTDLRMPGEDGLMLLRTLKRRQPSLPIVVLTGHGSVPSAVECMKAGACDYLQKPVDPEQIVLILERLLEESTMRRELEYLRSQSGAGPQPRDPIGESPRWREVIELVEAVSPTDSSILLLGESGTGKDEVAKLIHRRSRRSGRPFVRVNCAAVPLDLFESEFFGHRKGAFTGALSDREGRFRVADRGTLFMDEIGSLPLTAQAKVLRVLQDGSFERVGDSRPTQVDVRLISATNSDLEAEVEAGRFRQDLYFRVNVMTIHLPPLRERSEDIPLLAAAFLEEFSRRLGKSITNLTEGALCRLQDYAWPGNVRELRNVMERAVLLEKEAVLSESVLPHNLHGGALSAESGSMLNLRRRLAEEEKKLLETALRASGGVRREAARLLGIDERNLSYFLKKHRIGGRG